jgi:ubiquinone/menaquinone biosynthesis C-methylase UbiE
VNLYEPAKYWQQRGKNYHHEENNEEMDILKFFLDDHSVLSILEVGSGYGRVYSYLDTWIPYTMVDFVDSFRETCYAKTRIMPDKWDAKTLPYSDNSFDLVLSFSVLLHVPFEDIRNHLRELMRVSKKYVFIATCDTGGDYGLDEGHCFRHDYRSLFAELGFTVQNTIVTCNGMRKVFMLRKD